MMHFKDSTSLTVRRLRSFVLLGALVALVILLLDGCGGEASEGSARPSGTLGAPRTVVTLYSSPT